MVFWSNPLLVVLVGVFLGSEPVADSAKGSSPNRVQASRGEDEVLPLSEAPPWEPCDYTPFSYPALIGHPSHFEATAPTQLGFSAGVAAPCLQGVAAFHFERFVAPRVSIPASLTFQQAGGYNLAGRIGVRFRPHPDLVLGLGMSGTGSVLREEPPWILWDVEFGFTHRWRYVGFSLLSRPAAALGDRWRFLLQSEINLAAFFLPRMGITATVLGGFGIDGPDRRSQWELPGSDRLAFHWVGALAGLIIQFPLQSPR